MNTILDLHLKHKYVVSVNKLDGGCSASFPNNFLLNTPNFSQIYLYNADKENLDVFKQINKQLSENKLIVPRYCARTLVILDIILATQKLNMSTELICFMDSDNKKINGYDELMPINLDAEEIVKEKKIISYLTRILTSDGNINSFEDELSDAVDLLSSCALNGGLLC